MENRKTHPHLIMAYGTLKRAYGNNRVLTDTDSIFVGDATTVEQHLLSGCGIPFVSRPPKLKRRLQPYLGRIRGEVWQLTDTGLAAADHLEGHPRFYCRTDTPVVLDGKADPITVGMYLIGRTSYLGLWKPDENGVLEWSRGEDEWERNYG